MYRSMPKRVICQQLSFYAIAIDGHTNSRALVAGNLQLSNWQSHEYALCLLRRGATNKLLVSCCYVTACQFAHVKFVHNTTCSMYIFA